MFKSIHIRFATLARWPLRSSPTRRPPTSPAPALRSSTRSCRSGRPTTPRPTGKKVNYQSIGSGGGIAQIKAATVDFGSSDAPLKPEELAKHGLAQFPSVIGGVVPVVNVPGVARAR